ncbi:BON domain-containing protein [Micromonospora sp. KC721]|uniref:BON domain-containing protein n=1 Tax=Micromonospora sp. KC721 TaxID=2530380 RepID=UPI00104A7713|nr:BON domain-containing protein [Micromonospora sp. KC721]TDB70891.1 BON domain-containing protein [Micromonospora sp. KC721]
MATATSVTRTDQDLRNDVLDELTWDPRVSPTGVGVIVTEGVVTLTGWVDSYAARWAAERAAHRVARVRAVANDLGVRIAPSAQRTDAEIALAAERALEWDAFVPVENLEVTVADGRVTLRGPVEWEYQRRAAERVVGRLTGVRGVSNGITVQPASRPGGDELPERIVDALVRSGATEPDRVSIQVYGDTAVVDGQVHSVTERDEVERIIWSAPGIREVHNHVTVTG